MTVRFIIVLSAVAVSALGTPALAGDGDGYRRAAVRDCTPINGLYGYYGNPWCDGWEGLEGRELRLTPPWAWWSDDEPPYESRRKRRYEDR